MRLALRCSRFRRSRSWCVGQKYLAHVEIDGVRGVIAPMLGKQPKDYHILYLTGSAPVFLYAEGQLYNEGPVVRIEQVSAAFPAEGAATAGN